MGKVSLHCKQQQLHYTVEANCTASSISLQHSRCSGCSRSAVAAAVALFSCSQLYSQQHLPSAFSLIRVQSQRGHLSFSISLPPFPFLFLLPYLFFFFSLPICDVAFVQGFKIQIGCVIQPDRLEVPCRDKRRTCSSQSAHAQCKGKFKG